MSVSGISINNAMASTQGMQRMQRPDPGKMADKLFSKLDSTGQGYIEKADLQSAFSNIKGASATDDASNVDNLFSRLDGNSDGKVTKDEFSSAMKKVTEQLDQQFMSMRMQGGAGEASGTNGANGASGNVQSASNDTNMKMMQQIMQLMRAYSVGNESAQPNSTLTVAA